MNPTLIRNLNTSRVVFAGLALAALMHLTARGQATNSTTTTSPAPTTATAESGRNGKDEVVNLESMIVTGTRRVDRTATESMAPVDIISADRLQMSVSPELMDKIMMDVPSFNVQRLPLSETTSFIRPARLRSLSSDHTLVLINGKRQHRTAGITSAGTQGVDYAQIPTSAIQRVEVLRDGASAQYGSDAIAGVINIILKRKPGYDGYVNLSQYYEGDGLTRQAGVDFGVALPKQGFLNVAVEYTNGDRTSRSIQRPDALLYVAAHPDRAQYVANPVQPWGQPERETKRLMANSEFNLTPLITLYAFGLYGQDKGTDDFNWRNPDTNAAFARSAYQNGPNAIFPTFSLVTIYPGGFTPLYHAATSDVTAAVGLKGAIENFTWDLSANMGRNVIDYTLSNSWNPSYGALSPREFNVGGLRQREHNLNADFTYTWDVAAMAKPVNVAFGLESRHEEFEIRAGERASWDIGPLVDLGVGANGYAGWTANQATTAGRTSSAAYVDVDLQLTRQFELGLAGRYEDYPDFGSKTNGKVSARFEVSPEFSLRATASTGFHAPTPGIQNYTRTSSGPLPGTQINSQTGLVSPSNPVAVFFGAKALKPETSTNYSAGMVFTPTKAFTVSIDAYTIEVDDRLGGSPTFILTDAQRIQLAASGVVDALNINRINFFTNALDTRTRGVDVVASYRWNLASKDTLTLTGAYNFNQTKLLRATAGLVDAEGRINLEHRIPQSAGNVSLEYTHGKLSLMGRVRYFGPWMSADSPVLHQTFSEQVLFDTAATWRFNSHLSLSIGAENLFDSYPEKALFNVAAGLIYSRFAPYDVDGGRYFSRLNFSF
ncbi:MAG: putative TonB dependent receptor [Verrucomicrobia bacterium]|nr:putative TonB dependent receptor [Verrucomicrobiota bacterium]